MTVWSKSFLYFGEYVKSGDKLGFVFSVIVRLSEMYTNAREDSLMYFLMTISLKLELGRK